MADAKRPLARNLGSFFGHIWKAVKTSPEPSNRQVVQKKVEEAEHGDMVLRRTTIDEIEVKGTKARRHEGTKGEEKK